MSNMKEYDIVEPMMITTLGEFGNEDCILQPGDGTIVIDYEKRVVYWKDEDLLVETVLTMAWVIKEYIQTGHIKERLNG